MFVNPNFPIVYNETLLHEAGVEGAPSSIPELDEINPKLVRRGSNGLAEQVGMIPRVDFGAAAVEFVNLIKEGGSISNGLAEMERRINILAGEAGILVQ